jgi:hypothetical protein
MTIRDMGETWSCIGIDGEGFKNDRQFPARRSRSKGRFKLRHSGQSGGEYTMKDLTPTPCHAASVQIHPTVSAL